MVLKLHGMDQSSPVRAVKLALAALGLDYEYLQVNTLEGENLTAEYLKKNPQHTIPLLEDDDFAIWDSHAISAYLVSVHAKDDVLYPKAPRARAVVDQRLHFDSEILFPRVRGITEPILYWKSGHVNQSSLALIPTAYEFLEKFLEKTNFLAGDQLTIADFCAIVNVTTLNFYLKIDEQRYPKTVAWIKRLSTLPYYESINGVGEKIFEDLVNSKLDKPI